ncbi:TPA_asm: P [Pogostemom alphacytorhabdovirus 2]|nr:TPA_asm: P [Pogostemom alphacytorhabdovirus 2]
MAQYESDIFGEDFSDIGDVLGNINYADLNSDDPPEGCIQVPMNTEVPLNAEESSDRDRAPEGQATRKRDIDPEVEDARSLPSTSKAHKSPSEEHKELVGDEAVATLYEVCDEVGIVASRQMESQIHRLSKIEQVTRISIRWFVRGYNNCLGSHILSTLRENMVDMKTEIKRLQSGTASMVKGSDALTAASNQLLSRIDSVKDDIRDRLHASLENVEGTVTDTLSRVRNLDVLERVKETRRELAEEIMQVTPKISPADTKGRKVPKIETLVPDTIPPVAEVGKHSQSTVADSDSPAKARRALMSRVGFTSSFSNNLSESVLLEAIPPSLLSEIKGMTISPRVKAAVKKIILNNIGKISAE